MDDDDIDTRLREHGTAWRTDNAMRPAVDWELVSAPRHRWGWLGVAGVAAAAAAIVVPLVLTSGGHVASPSPTPVATPTGKPVPLAVAQRGAPKRFVVLQDGALTFVQKNGLDGENPTGSRVVAVAVNQDATIAYGANNESGCRTHIDRDVHRGYPPHNTRDTLSDALTIAGHATATGMALSPDGTRLALVVTPPYPATTEPPGVTHPACGGAPELVVINLTTKTVERAHAAGEDEALSSLQWAPDSRHLALLVQRSCQDCSAVPAASEGTHVVDVNDLHGVDSSTRVLPLDEPVGSTGAGPSYGVVFWWHGEMVAFSGTTLRVLNGHGGLGKVVATGLPDGVVTVSCDPTGNHLLMNAAPYQTQENGPTVGSRFVRWDNGEAAEVAVKDIPTTNWSQPGW